MIDNLNEIVETVTYDLINGIKIYHNTSKDAYPIHWHTVMEIIMPIKGAYRVDISEEPVIFKEGEILVIPPGEVHTLAASSFGERLILLFDYSLIGNLKDMSSLLERLHPFKLISRENEPLIIHSLFNILKNIETEYFSDETYREAYIHSLLICFFVLLGRNGLNIQSRFPNITTNKQHEYVEKFMSVCSYINEHCTENITVEQLADIAGFSRFHFARLFKQFTNISYYDYLTRKRIAYAEKLLTNPDITITEVAMQSGFNSLSTFNRVFKTTKKCTPSEYKSLNIKQKLELPLI